MKMLKSTRAAISPEEMLRVAGNAAPLQPPAVASIEPDKSAMLSVRMMEETLEALATYAHDRGTTQRRVIAEALVKHGVRVSARDLQDRPLPRRRGVRPA